MDKPKIGIIGAGRLGTAVGRLLSAAKYDVAITNSKGKESLELQLQIMMPSVVAMDVNDLIEWAEVVILAVPLPRYTQLPLEKMSGKLVIDAMNYWAPVDGKIKEFDEYAGSSSELVAASMPGTRAVKAFNTIAYGELEEHGLAEGRSGVRRAIPLAGDDFAAKQIVSTLIDTIGFDPVDLGPLKIGKKMQPDTKLFNNRLTKDQVLSLL